MASSFQVVPQSRTSRTPRRPQHSFNLEVRPFQLQPFMLAPVLPGETMKNLLLQARVVSDPLKNPLTGWWCEFYYWYVKHRDLDEPMRTDLINIMIDPTKSIAARGGALPEYFSLADGAGYLDYIMKRIAQTYFRDINEDPDDHKLGNLFLVQVNQQSFLDSALKDSDYLAGTADDLVVGVDDTISGQELSQSYILWQQYRAANLTHMTYEEYLSTYGIPLPQGSDSDRRPELVRFVHHWTYPVNTVNPADGTPSSAVSWAISERADKDRFFREPGWLLGCMTVRPKVYMSGHRALVANYMKDGLSWLPAVMGDNPEYSLRKFALATGPLPTQTADYRIDLKDLFLYGEQFVNYDVTAATNKPLVALPTTGMQKKYPSGTDIDALFKTGTANKVRVDGITSLNILGMQIDTSPTSQPGGF